MNQIMVKMTLEMKDEFQRISRRRADNPSELVREWVKHYINEYREQEEMLLTIKRIKVNEAVKGIDYIDEYELNHTVKLAKNKLKDIVSQYNQNLDTINPDLSKKIKKLMNLDIIEVVINTGDYDFHIKNELLKDTLYGLYKGLENFIDLISLSYRDIRFYYYLNLEGGHIVFTKEGEVLKDWGDGTTKSDIIKYLKSIELDTFTRQ